MRPATQAAVIAKRALAHVDGLGRFRQGRASVVCLARTAPNTIEFLPCRANMGPRVGICRPDGAELENVGDRALL